MVRASILALILLCSGMAFAQEATSVADTLLVPELEISEVQLPPAIQKSELLDWIDAARALQPRDEVLWHSVEHLPLQYRFGSTIVQMHADPYLLKVYGFERPQSVMDTAIYLDYLSRYHYFSFANAELDAGHFSYPLPVAVSGLEGSLGDYDSREVSAFLAKQGLFGFEGAGLHLDYTLQNGYWLDMPQSGSSLRPYLSYRYKDLQWAIEYASYQKDGSSLEMLPYYWTPNVYRVKHKYNHLYTHLKHPCLQLSFIRSKDSSASPSFVKNLDTDALQVALERTFSYKTQSLALRYEYAEISRNYLHADSYNTDAYSSKLSADLVSKSWLELQGTVDLMDWERVRSHVTVQKELGSINLGLYDRRYWSEREERYAVNNPLDGTTMSAVSIFSDAESGLSAQWQDQALKLSASLGYQSISQASLRPKREDDQALLRLNAAYHPRFDDWELLITPSWKMQDNSIYLMENPQFIFSSSQSLTRHLGYDNALSAGFRILGHSDYYLAHGSNPTLVEASTTLDLWLGVKIGRLFDINVSAQNVLDSSIFGVYPIPPSVHVRLRWFFIN